MVAAVAITPILLFLVAFTAARQVGVTTPVKGTGRLCPMDAATELTVPQAAIIIFTFCERRKFTSCLA